VKRFSAKSLLLVSAGALCFLSPLARASAPHFWHIPSPDHEQTFAYGTETNRVWTQWGRDKHLALLLNFTNDPYVDRDNPRRYDNFRFSFPSVTLGKDAATFYYHTSDGRSIPVARQTPDFLGIDEIKLLPNASLRVEKPHGYLTLTLIVQDRVNAVELQ
jgi:hypothetical protein